MVQLCNLMLMMNCMIFVLGMVLDASYVGMSNSINLVRNCVVFFEVEMVL